MPQTEILQKIFFLKENIFRVASLPKNGPETGATRRNFPCNCLSFLDLFLLLRLKIRALHGMLSNHDFLGKKVDNTYIIKRSTIMKKSLLVRHYVMRALFRNDRASVKMPSKREFAEMFQMSVSMVSLILDGLVREGYLTARQGVGYFTTPQRVALGQGKLLGLIWGDGKAYSKQYEQWVHEYQLGLDLVRAGHSIRELLLEGDSEDTICREIAINRFDGLIWCAPGEQECNLRSLRKLRAAGLPVITLEQNVADEIDSIEFEQAPAFADMGRHLALAGHRRVLLFSTCPLANRAIRDAFLAECPQGSLEINREPPEVYFPRIDEIVAADYDCIIANPLFKPDFHQAVRRANLHTDVYQLICFPSNGVDFSWKQDFETIGKLLLKRFSDIWDGDTAPRHLTVPMIKVQL